MKMSYADIKQFTEEMFDYNVLDKFYCDYIDRENLLYDKVFIEVRFVSSRKEIYDLRVTFYDKQGNESYSSFVVNAQMLDVFVNDILQLNLDVDKNVTSYCHVQEKYSMRNIAVKLHDKRFHTSYECALKLYNRL